MPKVQPLSLEFKGLKSLAMGEISTETYEIQFSCQPRSWYLKFPAIQVYFSFSSLSSILKKN